MNVGNGPTPMSHTPRPNLNIIAVRLLPECYAIQTPSDVSQIWDWGSRSWTAVLDLLGRYRQRNNLQGDFGLKA